MNTSTEILQEQITALQERVSGLNNWQVIMTFLILFIIMIFSLIEQNNRDIAIKESNKYTDTQIKKLSDINIERSRNNELSRNIESLIDTISSGDIERFRNNEMMSRV